jgi:hypothetical protein
MALYVSKTSGNFTSAGTWELVDSNSQLISVTGSGVLTTSYVASATFSPGAVTVTGVGLLLSTRVAAATGTFDIQLYNLTLATQTNIVTINVSDISLILNSLTWIYFRFSSGSLLSATQSYQIRAKTSAATQITLYTNGVAGNWSRFITTSTTGNPTASDSLYVVGQYTGQGTSASVTVTMDNNTSVQYGPMSVGSKGVVDWATQSTTQLWLGGDLYQPTQTNSNISLYVNDGVFQMGTSMSRIADSVTASLYMNAQVLNFGRIYLGYNAVFRASGKTFSNSWTTLTSDLAVSGTTASVSSTSGWRVSDEIVLAPTSRTANQFDRRGLSSVSGTTIGFAASTNAHSGTGNFAGEVINLTRNCKIYSVSQTARPYILSAFAQVTVDIDSVEFIYFGSTNGAVYVNGNHPSPYFSSVKNCSFRDGGVGITLTTGGSYSNTTIDNNVYHSTNASTPGNFINGAVPTSVGISTNSYISNNVLVYSVGSGAGISIPNCIIDLENNRITGYVPNNGGILYGFNNYYLKTGKFNNNIVRASNNGILLSTIDTLDTGYHQTGNKSIRNVNYGFYLQPGVNSRIENLVAIGNSVANIVLQNAVQSQVDNLFINNATVQGETSFTCPYGLYTLGTVPTSITFQTNATFNNCSFGTHSTSDIRFNTATNVVCNLIFNNSYFTSAIELSQPSFMSKGSRVSIQRANGVNGAHRTYFRDGLLTLDTTIYRSSTKSVRLAPTSAAYSQSFGNKIIPVKASSTPTISVWVRKSATGSGDSSTYNGSQPRLWLRQNSALASFSNYDDIVLATASAANGTWEQLSATLPVIPYEDTAFEVYVDCNGTTGWVNIDDWRVSQ